jgi:hypothetical protein
MLSHIAGWIIARAIGLMKDNWTTTDFAFDVLSLQALFLVVLCLTHSFQVPRAFSFLGLWQYYGQLLPSMTFVGAC